jgi:predicted metalloendopeptidase
MNATEHEALGNKPLKYVFEEIGGWPIAAGSQWNEDNFTLEGSLVRLKELGYDHDFLAKIEIAPHILAHQYNLIYIGPPELGLDDKSYYTDEAYSSTLDAYLNFMIQAAVELGSKSSLEEIQKEMQHVLDFEKELAKVCIF